MDPAFYTPTGSTMTRKNVKRLSEEIVLRRQI